MPTRTASLLLLALAASLLAGPHPLGGQGLYHGSVQGVVLDSLGRALPGSTVVLQETRSGLSQSVAATRDGRFDFLLVPPGRYRLIAERYGYRPSSLEPVAVWPGRGVEVALTLSPGGDAVLVEEVRFRRNVPERGDWFPRTGLADLAGEDRTLSALARLSADSDGALEAAGLPLSATGVAVDGFALALGGAPAVASAAQLPVLPPLGALEEGGAAVQIVDVEWNGITGGLVGATTRRGTGELTVEAMGSWASVLGRPVEGALGVDERGYRGGVVVGGPLIRDTAIWMVGVEGVRRDPAGLSIGLSSAPERIRSDHLSAFGRLDWQLTPAHSLSVRTVLSALPNAHEEPGASTLLAVGSRYRASGLFGGLVLASRLGGASAQEFRLGLQSHRQAYVADDPAALALRGEYAQGQVQATELVHARLGSHRLKLGVQGGARWYDVNPREDASVGAGRSGGNAAGPVAFALPQIAIFAQDEWRAALGLELTLGLRYDNRRLPRERVMPSREWYRRTGLVSNDFRPSQPSFSPRLGFRWDVQGRHRWVLNGAAGVYQGVPDPTAFAEAMARDGLPGDSGASRAAGDALTLLPPGFDGPRSLQATLGSWLALGASSGVRLGATVRRTGGLVRRYDANLHIAALGTAHGRPLHGHLRWEDGKVAAAGGPLRRFPELGEVAVLAVDGRSTYRAFSAAYEWWGEAGPTLLVRYIYSRATDNVLGARDGRSDAALAPLPASAEGADWREGPSDFDVPHRLVAGADVRLPFLRFARLAALYRFRSGLPFTPAFRGRVDANGDGSALNDPAIVDDRVPGLDALLGSWDCLREQVGALAARNSCRGPASHALDLRLSLALVRARRFALGLTVDALNLTDGRIHYLDSALLLVDPAARGAGDGGATRLPLLANPGFGAPLLGAVPGRAVRLGFQMSY